MRFSEMQYIIPTNHTKSHRRKRGLIGLERGVGRKRGSLKAKWYTSWQEHNIKSVDVAEAL